MGSGNVQYKFSTPLPMDPAAAIAVHSALPYHVARSEPGSHHTRGVSVYARSRCLPFVGVGLALLAATASPLRPATALAAGATTSTVSLFDGASGAAADQGAFSPSLSADGRFVAFESRSLLTGDPTGGRLQVFLRDRQLGRTFLVSRAGGAGGAMANCASDAPSISADGRFIAFESCGSNLVGGFVAANRQQCDNGTGELLGDVYVRDTLNNTTTLVSHALGAPAAAGGQFSEDPAISADGSTIVFDSAATNIAADGAEPDRGCQAQAFATRLASGATSLVSRADGPSGAMAGDQLEALNVNANGNIVAFVSDGTNLVNGVNTPGEAYVRDLGAGSTQLVSMATGPSGAPDNDGAGGSVSLSADGRFVSFVTESSNLGVNNNTNQEVYVRDRTMSTTTLVSLGNGASGTPGDGDSGPAVLSSDGRLVAFETAAPNLGGATSPLGETTQVLMRDTLLNTTTTVSRASGDTGTVGNDQSQDVAISASGQSVGFQSSASNLTSTDNRTADQVYVRDLTIQPAPSPPGPYHAVAPARFLDTRPGTALGGTTVQAHSSIDLHVTGVAGVPATGVAAVVFNLSQVNATATSFFTAYPAGQARPLASALNFSPGPPSGNLVEVAVSPLGTVTLYNDSGSVDAIGDMQGYVSTTGDGKAGLYTPVVPARVLDTRPGTALGGTTIGANSSIDVQITGTGGIPATGVAAVVLNLTAANATSGSYMTAFATGSARPMNVSSLNFAAGQVIGNRVIVPVGTAGKITIYNNAGTADAIGDVNGWFSDDSVVSSGAQFVGIVPSRVLDTRAGGTGPGAGTTLGPGQTETIQITGVGNVPPNGGGTTVRAVVLKVTSVGPTASTFFTLFPNDAAKPFVSDLNPSAGQVLNNLVVVKLGPTGAVSLYNDQGNCDAVFDAVGYYV
jgi:hypothetical protein